MGRAKTNTTNKDHSANDKQTDKNACRGKIVLKKIKTEDLQKTRIASYGYLL
ncbi:MAG: hypothetical protein RR397_02135 [Odoribacter sp.]